MPLVGIAELMAQSAASAGLMDPHLGITVENLYVENGLKFADDVAKSLFIKLEASPTHTKATLFYPFVDSRGRTVDPERVVATAILKSVTSKVASQRLPHIPVAPWHNVGYPGEESVIYHGPPFRCWNRRNTLKMESLRPFAPKIHRPWAVQDWVPGLPQWE